MREERLDAGLRLGLVPEDLDPAVLSEYCGVEGHGAEGAPRFGAAQPEPDPKIVDRVHGGQREHRDNEHPQDRGDELVAARPQSWSPCSVLRRRGSSQSRRWSPSRLTASTVTKIARPGNAVSHQAVLR